MGGYHTGTFPAVKPPRKVYMDVLRVVATVFVICVHTVALAKTTAAPGTLLFRVLEVFNYTFLSCNLFFVMISGALLLPVKGERCRDFFARRFIRVFIPLVVYYLSLIHISEPTRQAEISYAVFCLKKKKTNVKITT